MNQVKLKNQKNWENQVKRETCKLVLYSALQAFKNKIIQIPVWRLGEQGFFQVKEEAVCDMDRQHYVWTEDGQQ